jgi:hypothetical protein
MTNLPKPITDKLYALNALVERYPNKMPLTVAAEFLEMNTDGLMSALTRGSAPFGFGYQKTDGGNRVAVIPTATFYFWYTNVRGTDVRAADLKK